MGDDIMPLSFALAGFYACFYGALGLLQPLLPLYLTAHGMPAHVATTVLALGPLAAIIVPPLAGFVADAFRARGALMRGATLLCAASLVAYLQVPSTVPAVVAVSIAYSIVRAPVPALVDAAAFTSTERSGTSYGRLRMFGSVGFLAAVLAGGELAHTYGWNALLAATTVAFAAAFVATVALPSEIVHAHRGRTLPWWEQLRRRELWLFLAVIAVSQMSSGAYDACYALHLQRLGFGERFIGCAWGTGVFAEVVVLMFSARLLRRYGPERLLAVAFATGALRWILVAGTTSASATLALQLLHGITYPLYWVPAMAIVHALTPRELVTAAQGMLAAAAAMGSVVGMSLAGLLLETGGGRSVYTCASATALVATVGAALLERQALAKDVARSREQQPSR